MKKITKTLLAAWVVLVALLMISTFIYVNDYYHSAEGNEVYLESTELVEISEIKEGLFFDGTGTEKALIFYPGGKVEYTAYAPIVRGLAENGIDCFLVKMPGNLAVFGVDKAEGIMERYKGYKDWYMAGHSLGGAMAASYVAEHLGDFAGLTLLGAYTTENLIPESGDRDEVREDFWVNVIYGTEDHVMNANKLAESYELMPPKSNVDVLTGGNHAQFGNYGIQKGDGAAFVSQEEQWKYTIEAILEHIAMEVGNK